MKNTLAILVFLMLLLSACSKFDDISTTLEEQVGIASVAVFNGLPSDATMEVYVDGSKLNVHNLEQFHNWLPGKRKLSIVYRDGVGKLQYANQIELEAGKFYSLFVYKDSEIRVSQQEENPIRPQLGFAKVRVAHMSSAIPGFDMRIQQDADVKPTYIGYKDITPYSLVRVGNQLVSGRVKDTSIDRVRDFDYAFTPKDQGVYTLIIRDNANPEDESDKYKIDLIAH